MFNRFFWVTTGKAAVNSRRSIKRELHANSILQRALLLFWPWGRGEAV